MWMWILRVLAPPPMLLCKGPGMRRATKFGENWIVLPFRDVCCLALFSATSRKLTVNTSTPRQYGVFFYLGPYGYRKSCNSRSVSHKSQTECAPAPALLWVCLTCAHKSCVFFWWCVCVPKWYVRFAMLYEVCVRFFSTPFSATTLEQHTYVTIIWFLFRVYFDLPYILVTALGRSEVLTNTSIQI